MPADTVRPARCLRYLSMRRIRVAQFRIGLKAVYPTLVLHRSQIMSERKCDCAWSSLPVQWAAVEFVQVLLCCNIDWCFTELKNEKSATCLGSWRIHIETNPVTCGVHPVACSWVTDRKMWYVSLLQCNGVPVHVTSSRWNGKASSTHDQSLWHYESVTQCHNAT